MAKINPNSAFTRIYLDLPTPVAIELDTFLTQQEPRVSRKDFVAKLVTDAVTAKTESTTAKRKAKK